MIRKIEDSRVLYSVRTGGRKPPIPMYLPLSQYTYDRENGWLRYLNYNQVIGNANSFIRFLLMNVVKGNGSTTSLTAWLGTVKRHPESILFHLFLPVTSCDAIRNKYSVPF